MTEKDGFIAAVSDRDSIIKMQVAEIERLKALAALEPVGDDCTPNHLCGGRMVHLPCGEQCNKCGGEMP